MQTSILNEVRLHNCLYSALKEIKWEMYEVASGKDVLIIIIVFLIEQRESKSSSERSPIFLRTVLVFFPQDSIVFGSFNGFSFTKVPVN